MLKINEVETCVGITKKNIRFYESEGLLAPRRNSENGYRDYSESDIEELKRIKLLRKLGFPLEEIRKMQSGELTVSDGMDRHRIALERENKNIVQSISLCEKLSQETNSLSELDASSVLQEMSSLESGGATFKNKYEKDRQINIFSSVSIASLTIAALLLVAWLAIWGMYKVKVVPFFVIAIVVTICIIIIGAVALALIMRLKEISNGEIEKAKRY